MSAAARPPVADWATDWDHLDLRYAERPDEVWADLRERCPLARTERYHGAWLPTRYHDVAAAAANTATFSSGTGTVCDEHPSEYRGHLPPINLDPPQHAPARRALLPPFGPRHVQALAGPTRDACHRLLDRFAGGHGADAANDYARLVPGFVTARQLGVPESDGDLFRHWVHETLEVGPTDQARARTATLEMFDYFRRELAERRDRGADPEEDLTAWVAASTLEGEPTPHKVQVGMLAILLLAGIDTTWSALGSALWHLATHPDDQARLRAEPELVPTAIEELLRFYAPASTARVTTEATELAGCPIPAGERVLLAWPAANRDPAASPDADRFVIDRQVNRHLAFGLGPHRCLGSNLARMELRVALEAFLDRVPPFRLADGAEVVWSTGQIRGPRTVPIQF